MERLFPGQTKDIPFFSDFSGVVDHFLHLWFCSLASVLSTMPHAARLSAHSMCLKISFCHGSSCSVPTNSQIPRSTCTRLYILAKIPGLKRLKEA